MPNRIKSYAPAQPDMIRFAIKKTPRPPNFLSQYHAYMAAERVAGRQPLPPKQWLEGGNMRKSRKPIDKPRITPTKVTPGVRAMRAKPYDGAVVVPPPFERPATTHQPIKPITPKLQKKARKQHTPRKRTPRPGAVLRWAMPWDELPTDGGKAR